MGIKKDENIYHNHIMMNETRKKTVGKMVRNARKKRKITMEQLARAIDRTTYIIHQLESGKLLKTLHNFELIKICDILDLNYDEVLLLFCRVPKDIQSLIFDKKISLEDIRALHKGDE